MSNAKAKKGGYKIGLMLVILLCIYQQYLVSQITNVFLWLPFSGQHMINSCKCYSSQDHLVFFRSSGIWAQYRTREIMFFCRLFNPSQYSVTVSIAKLCGHWLKYLQKGKITYHPSMLTKKSGGNQSVLTLSIMIYWNNSLELCNWFLLVGRPLLHSVFMGNIGMALK